MRFHLCLIFLISFLSAHAEIWVNQNIISSDSCDQLKNELTKINLACRHLNLTTEPPEYQCHQENGKYQVDITKYIPKALLNYYNSNIHHAGPNCYNSVLVAHNYLNNFTYSSLEELLYWLNSQQCQEIENPQPGDIGTIWFSGHLDHAYIYISNNLAFSKNGLYPSEPYQIQSNLQEDSLITDYYRYESSEKFYRCQSLEDSSFTSPYKCQLDGMDCQLGRYIFEGFPLDENNLNEIGLQLNAINQLITKEKMSAINSTIPKIGQLFELNALQERILSLKLQSAYLFSDNEEELIDQKNQEYLKKYYPTRMEFWNKCANDPTLLELSSLDLNTLNSKQKQEYYTKYLRWCGEHRNQYISKIETQITEQQINYINGNQYPCSQLKEISMSNYTIPYEEQEKAFYSLSMEEQRMLQEGWSNQTFFDGQYSYKLGCSPPDFLPSPKENIVESLKYLSQNTNKAVLDKQVEFNYFFEDRLLEYSIMNLLEFMSMSPGLAQEAINHLPTETKQIFLRSDISDPHSPLGMLTEVYASQISLHYNYYESDEYPYNDSEIRKHLGEQLKAFFRN